jgi:hypothetical protein
MIFVTEDVCMGQLFDAQIFRKTDGPNEQFACILALLGILQVATISLRDNPEDEAHVAGIK